MHLCTWLMQSAVGCGVWALSGGGVTVAAAVTAAAAEVAMAVAGTEVVGHGGGWPGPWRQRCAALGNLQRSGSARLSAHEQRAGPARACGPRARVCARVCAGVLRACVEA